MNAINTDLAQGLLAAIGELDNSDDLTAGVLTGAGRGFCSGMDLKAFAAGGTPEGMQEAVFTSNDAKEVPRAFAEKRASNWSGS